MNNQPCGHSFDHFTGDVITSYCNVCAHDPALTDWMTNSNYGDRLPAELYTAGEAALRCFAADIRQAYAFADQHEAGTHPHDYKFDESSRLDMARWNRNRAESLRCEADNLARALGYEVLPPPASPRWQAADGRKVYL